MNLGNKRKATSYIVFSYHIFQIYFILLPYWVSLFSWAIMIIPILFVFIGSINMLFFTAHALYSTFIQYYSSAAFTPKPYLPIIQHFLLYTSSARFLPCCYHFYGHPCIFVFTIFCCIYFSAKFFIYYLYTSFSPPASSALLNDLLISDTLPYNSDIFLLLTSTVHHSHLFLIIDNSPNWVFWTITIWMIVSYREGFYGNK